MAATAAGTYRELSESISSAAYIFVGIIVVFLVAVFVGKKILERIERRHLAEDQDHIEVETRDVKD